MPKLTQSLVKNLSFDPESPQKLILDDELIGFAVRVSLTKKVFYLQMRDKRQVKKRKIGEYGVMTVDEARRRAIQLKGQILSGNDAHLERKNFASGESLDALFDLYIETKSSTATTEKSVEAARKKFGKLNGMMLRKEKRAGRIGQGDDAEAYTLVPLTLPDWLNRQYRDITEDEIRERFDKLKMMAPTRAIRAEIAPITRTANQTFKWLQAMYANVIELNDLGAKGYKNPVEVLTRTDRWAPINRRSSFLDVAKPEFVKWWAACEALEPKIIGDYLRFTLLTGSRSIETATLSWKTVNMQEGYLVFEKTKNGLDYKIPIAPEAMRILRRRKKEQINDFVFGYAESKTGHVVCPPQNHIELVRKSCGKHWAMHDLRRTFTTTMTGLNIHQFTVAHLLKHSPNLTITFSYSPPTQDQLLDALVKFERHILKRVRT